MCFWLTWVLLNTLQENGISLFQKLSTTSYPQIGVRIHEPLHLHARMLTGLILGKSCASSHSCWVHQYSSSVIYRRHCLTPVLSGLWSSQSFSSPSYTKVPEPLWWEMSHLWLSTPLTFILFYQLWVSGLITSHRTKKLLWWHLRTALIYGHRKQGYLIVCTFNEIIEGSLPAPVSSLAVRSDQIYRTRHGFPPVAWTLIQKAALHAIVVVYLATLVVIAAHRVQRGIDGW